MQPSFTLYFLMDDLAVKLAAHGFAVLTDVLTGPEFDEYGALLRGWLDALTDADRLAMDKAPHGVQKYREVGHQAFAWFLRTRPAIQAPFRKLWRTGDLVTSFDGIQYQSGTKARRDTHWGHTDQAPADSSLKCYQGYFSLTANIENTFVCWPGTHAAHAAYARRNNLKHKRNWQKVDEAFLADYQRTVVPLPANSLLLWDSRLVHQSQYGGAREPRIGQYVCFLPRRWSGNTAAQQKKRKANFAARRMTSHWPYPIKTNALQPQHYGDYSQVIDYDAIPAPDLAPYAAAIDVLL